ncbi:MAG: hypothetical protein U1E60_14830 [Reyranellaceae bacterium]
MTAGSTDADSWRRVRRVVAATFVAICVLGAVRVAPVRADDAGLAPTVGERIALLIAERATLQGRASGEARLFLLPVYRMASLLTDALAVRSESDGHRPFDDLVQERRRSFDVLDGVNGALRDALDRPGDGSVLAAGKEAERATAELERLGSADEAPLVLSYTPRFVPPRRAGELTLSPMPSSPAPRADALRVEVLPAPSPNLPGSAPTQAPTVPRYAPDFAAANEEDPPVEVSVAGAHLAATAGPPPVLAVGAWRGAAVVEPERLRFSVPRSAFATDATRTTFAIGTLLVRRPSRVMTFQLLFTVLPDRPGAFALDQRATTMAPESKTLVSPEIVVRAAVGETRTLRRCFDPPAGWRFDAERRRVVVVERLAWQDDVTDSSLNSGSVQFVPADQPGQICVAVIARPVSKTVRTATIGRFEATLLEEKPVEQVTKSGVRALDWREAVRMPFEKGVTEWKLYVRLFGEIDREFDGTTRPALPFLRLVRDPDDHVLILKADQTAEP